MKTLSPRHARRLKKLQELLKRVGGPAQAERDTGTPKSHFSALIAGKRGVGDQLASKLERRYELPSGWFDQETGDFMALVSADVRARIDALPDAERRALARIVDETLRFHLRLNAPEDADALRTNDDLDQISDDLSDGSPERPSSRRQARS